MKSINSYLGKLTEVAAKHRSNILVLSVIVIWVDPNVVISFGSASLVGLGITIAPEQDINVGYVLLGLLAYRLAAFWVTMLSTNGLDFSAAESRALAEFQPDYLDDQQNSGSLDQEVKRYARSSVLKWRNFSIIWDIYMPTILGLGSIVAFVWKLSHSG